MTKKNTKLNKNTDKQNVKSTKKKRGVKNPENDIDTGKKYKTNEYIQFVLWTAMPTFEREPGTQGLFAKQYKLREETLSAWKNEDTFWSDVRKVRQAYMRDDFGDIIKALKKGIIKRGNGADVKVYAQLAGEMKEDNEFSLSPLLEGAIAKINKKLPD